jgi:hypothetical protein
MSDHISAALKNWVPYRLIDEDGHPICRWLYLGDKKITEPFFVDTIGKCRKLPENSRFKRCVSSISILPEWSTQVNTVAPSAIIFHISRCGSTLISQLLAQQPSSIVLSEVPFFDEILRWGFKTNNSSQASVIVKAAIELYGAGRTDQCKHMFIKADSWHIHFYEQLRQLFPQTPFILLYRRPDEVLRSQQKKRGMQAVPGVIEPGIFGFDAEQIMHLSLDEYMADVIETYLQAFINILQNDQYAYPVNYNEGGIPIVNKIAALTGMSFNNEETAAMQLRSGFHAKEPGEIFNEPVLNEPVPAYLDRSFELYDELEKIRLK